MDDSGGEEMFEDLGRFETGAIPVDAVMKQGRAIRNRRRAFGGSALAVAAALSIGVPVALAGGSSSGYNALSGGSGVYGATSSGGRVTLNPVPFSKGKGQFSGAIDGKKWSVGFDNQNCYNILWACGSDSPHPQDNYATLAVNATAGQPNDYTIFMQRNVARVTVTLQNGETLRFEAVPVEKTPVVLFALPPGLGVSKIDLFDARGAEIAYSYPFSAKGSFSAAGIWYKPGEKPIKDAGSVEVFRGKFANGLAVFTAYVGPSGPCLVSDAAGNASTDCTVAKRPVTGSSPEMNFSVQESGSPGGRVEFAASGVVGPTVSRMQIDYADGTSSPIAIKSLGGYRFFAYVVPKDKDVTGVTAFDTAGKPLPVEKNAG